jgi:hypothetical protein
LAAELNHQLDRRGNAAESPLPDDLARMQPGAAMRSQMGVVDTRAPGPAPGRRQ